MIEHVFGCSRGQFRQQIGPLAILTTPRNAPSKRDHGWTRWALKWFEQYGVKDGPYGDAETLASTTANTFLGGTMRTGSKSKGILPHSFTITAGSGAFVIYLTA